MLDEIFSFLSTALSDNTGLALLASFLWGVLSIILSPCHLSSIPLVIGFLNTQHKMSTQKSISLSLLLSVGILISITVIGIITALLGRLLGDIGKFGNYIVAFVFMVIGLYLLDVIRLNWSGIALSPTKQKGPISALILGLLFGIGLGPCTFAFLAPVLGVVFRTAHTNFIYASSLLLLFGIGHCSVIVTAGLLGYKVQRYLNWSEESKTITYVKKVCGLLVMFGGVYILYVNY